MQKESVVEEDGNQSRRFERKISGRLFLRDYYRFLQLLQSGSGFGLFFPLIIHIQIGKLHFGPHDKNEGSKRKKTIFDI